MNIGTAKCLLDLADKLKEECGKRNLNPHDVFVYLKGERDLTCVPDAWQKAEMLGRHAEDGEPQPFKVIVSTY
jgi:hypothetical protein